MKKSFKEFIQENYTKDFKLYPFQERYIKMIIRKDLKNWKKPRAQRVEEAKARGRNKVLLASDHHFSDRLADDRTFQ